MESYAVHYVAVFNIDSLWEICIFYIFSDLDYFKGWQENEKDLSWKAWIGREGLEFELKSKDR